MVLVSKAEKLADEKKDELMAEIKPINLFATIKYSSFGDVEFQLNHIQGKLRNAFDFMSFTSSHSHIQTKSLRFDKPLNKTEFLRWLEYTLDIYKNQIYRCKGMVCFQGEPFEYIIQGVGGTFEITEGDLIVDSFISEVVFIGKLLGVDLEFE